MTQTKVEASQERKRVGMLVPPPILLAVLVAACILTQFAIWGWRAPSMGRAVASMLVLATAVSLVASSARRFVAASTPIRPVSATTRIVCSGVYAFSRNPMYLGMAGILLALAIFANSLIFALAAIVFVVVTHFAVVLPEERYLETLHRAEYVAYKNKVRRWL